MRVDSGKKTTLRPRMVATARPGSSQPLKGVLRPFERNDAGFTVHDAVGSITVRSAVFPNVTPEIALPKTRAGPVVSQAIN